MKRSHFWLGLVVGAILAAILLFSVYYVPRKGIALSREPLPFTLVLAQANGLSAGSPVLVSGVEAGEIEAIEIRPLPGRGYKVLAQVAIFDGERFAPMLRTDSVYQVAQSGLLGETTLSIVPGGEGISVRDQLVDGLPPADFSRILADLAQVSQNLAQVSKRVADFIDGREAGDPNLRRALMDLQETIRNVRDFSEKLPK